LQNAHSQYKETQILTATPGQLVVLLYEGAIKNLRIALESIEDKKKFDVVNNCLIKAQDIITELMLSLNFEADEIANRLYSLYIYFNNKLIEANIYKDAEKIREVLNYLEDLNEGWKKIANQSVETTPTRIGLDIST